MDYTCERGAKRNFEPWRESKLAEETEEERLDRIQKEEDEKDAMKDLEKKTIDAKTEMAIADALDDVRHRNAARARAEMGGAAVVEAPDKVDEEAERIERELEEQARMAFQSSTGERVRRLGDDGLEDETEREAADRIAMPPPAVPSFERQVKKKKEPVSLLGIKKPQVIEKPAVPAVATGPVSAAPAAAPAAGLGLGAYDSDDDD